MLGLRCIVSAGISGVWDESKESAMLNLARNRDDCDSVILSESRL